VGTAGAAHALLQLQRFAAAGAMLEQSRKACPDDCDIALLSALIATRSEHWREALERWENVQAIWQDCPSAAARREVIRKHAR
jgi:hypothetical protein